MKDRVKIYDGTIEKRSITLIEAIAIIIVFLVSFWAGYFCRNKYDVNEDGKVTAEDYVLVKNYIMSREGKE